MAYTWIYLLYLHLNLMNHAYILWLHQTLALRLVGLAFELNGKAKTNTDQRISTSKLNMGDNQVFTQNPSAVDIIAYAYFFIGLHKGPYYRWKILEDHFNSPLSVLGDFRIITLQKMKKALMCVIGYLILRLKFSPNIYYEDAFYTTFGTDFRYLYNVPQLVMFCLKYQIIMLLCTSVCTETGFGVYPANCQAVPGYGPTLHQSLLKFNSNVKTLNLPLDQEYNFSILKCFQNEKLLMGPKMRDTLRSWDMPTRYWFRSYVFKDFLKANKEVRSAFSSLAWSVWCGPSLQQLIISATLWVHVHLETEYDGLYDTAGSMATVSTPKTLAVIRQKLEGYVGTLYKNMTRNKKQEYVSNIKLEMEGYLLAFAVDRLMGNSDEMKVPWNIGFSIMRMFCLIYLTPCFVVTDTAAVFKYYNSIFWSFHIVLLILIVTAVIIYKIRGG